MKQKICFNLMATLAFLMMGSASGMQKTSAAKSAKATESGCQFTIQWDPKTSIEQSTYFNFNADNISTLGSINEDGISKPFSAYNIRLKHKFKHKTYIQPYDEVELFMVTNSDEKADVMPLKALPYSFLEKTDYHTLQSIKKCIESIQNRTLQAKINNEINTPNMLIESNPAWIELYNLLAELINKKFTKNPQIIINELSKEQTQTVVTSPAQKVAPQSIKVEIAEQKQIIPLKPIKSKESAEYVTSEERQKTMPTDKPAKETITQKQEEVSTAAIPEQEFNRIIDTFKAYDPNNLSEAEFKNYMNSMNRIDEQGSEKQKNIFNKILNEESKIAKITEEAPDISIPQEEAAPPLPPQETAEEEVVPTPTTEPTQSSIPHVTKTPMNLEISQPSTTPKPILSTMQKEKWKSLAEEKLNKRLKDSREERAESRRAASEERKKIPTIIEQQQTALIEQLPPTITAESTNPVPQGIVPLPYVETVKVPEEKQKTTSTTATVPAQTSVPNPIEKTTLQTTAPITSEITTTRPTSENIAPITKATHRVATSLNATTRKFTKSSQALKIDSQSSSQFQSQPVSQSRPNELRRGALAALAVTKNTAAWIAAKLTGTHYLSEEASPELNAQLKELNETNILKNRAVSIGGKDYTLAKEFNAIETAGYSTNDTSKIGDGNHYEIYLMPDDAHFVYLFGVISSLLADSPDLKDYIAFIALRPTDKIYDSYGLASIFSRQVLPRILICFKTKTENARDKVKELVGTINTFIESKQEPFTTMQPAGYHPRNSQKLTDYIFVGFGSPDYKKLHPGDFERHTIWGGLRSANDDMAYPKGREKDLRLTPISGVK